MWKPKGVVSSLEKCCLDSYKFNFTNKKQLGFQKELDEICELKAGGGLGK